ncbi:hypothetical protein [Acetobacter malorum]|uniref:hypothetical protein n=1 Tax=Acetobacter malorum TaxID=178901 RepID=UPI0018D453C2|nr:hypothetical protein [Acetobacter malorum]
MDDKITAIAGGSFIAACNLLAREKNVFDCVVGVNYWEQCLLQNVFSQNKEDTAVEKLSEDFKARQKPVSRIIVAVSAAVAGFLIMLFRAIKKPR